MIERTWWCGVGEEGDGGKEAAAIGWVGDNGCWGCGGQGRDSGGRKAAAAGGAAATTVRQRHRRGGTGGSD